MAASFRIERTVPTTYLNNANDPVKGYTVYVTLLDWNEGHNFDVPTLDTKVIAERIQVLIEERQALDDMS